MNPRIWALDLEMNQPSGKIIQVGAIIGDLRTGEVLKKFREYVNPQEMLDSRIIKLTGIEQKDVDLAQDLYTVAQSLCAFIKDNKAMVSPIVWGSGDLRTLKHQISGHKDLLIHGIHREFDTKTIHQTIRLLTHSKLKGGLETAMKCWSIEFEGRPHDAYCDAHNTFKLFFHISRILSEKLQNFFPKT